MKVKDIANIIENYAPLESAEGYDNSGLTAGSLEQEVNGIMVCLDATTAVVEAAEKAGCNLIVSHHPFVFTAVKKFYFDAPFVKTLNAAYNRGISIYAAHTNFDKCPFNMSRVIAKKLGLKNATALTSDGYGAVGTLEQEEEFNDFKKMLAGVLNAECLKGTDTGRKICKVAIINGAGGDGLADAVAADADVFVTAEIKHHQALEAVERGISLIDGGHYETEIFFKDVIFDILVRHFDTKVVKFDSTSPLR